MTITRDQFRDALNTVAEADHYARLGILCTLPHADTVRHARDVIAHYSALTDTTPVWVQIEGDQPFPTTLGDLAMANSDSAEIAACVAAISEGRSYKGGGGAAAAYIVAPGLHYHEAAAAVLKTAAGAV